MASGVVPLQQPESLNSVMKREGEIVLLLLLMLTVTVCVEYMGSQQLWSMYLTTIVMRRIHGATTTVEYVFTRRIHRATTTVEYVFFMLSQVCVEYMGHNNCGVCIYT
ncbi:hypothetical protein I3760_03G211900 [Carya illinoinensis]|nr:hypothetical protein I3760_03G211900 [Carya illinoinensis]